jgi:hypothetical protein
VSWHPHPLMHGLEFCSAVQCRLHYLHFNCRQLCYSSMDSVSTRANA